MNLKRPIKFKSVRKRKQDELERQYQVQVGEKKGSKMNMRGSIKFKSVRKRKQDELEKAYQVHLGEKKEAR